MRSRLVRAVLVCAVLPILALVTYTVVHAIEIPNTTAYTQSFDAIGQAATAALPADFRVDRTTTTTASDARKVGTYAGAVTATALAGGASLSSTAGNGIYNFGAGTATTWATSADRAVGFLSSGSGTASGNLYARLTNTTGGTLTGLQISYDVEKYRGGTNAAGFRIQMFYSTDGIAWTSAGSDFATLFAPDGANAGYATAPGQTTNVSQTLTLNIPTGSDFYLAWNYSVATGTTYTNAQALAVDNISILGLGGGTGTPPSGTLTANAQTYSPGDPIILTVAVTPGSSPASTGLGVTANLSSLGLSAAAAFRDDGLAGDPVAGDNSFTFSSQIPANATGGLKNLTATIADAQSRTGTTPQISVTLLTPSAPTASGTAAPSSVAAGLMTQLTVTVTPGTNPTSSGLTVIGDLSAIMPGNTAQPFAAGPNNTFTFTATVDPGTPKGAKSLPITIGDAEGRSAATAIALTVTPPLVDSTIVISQLYGGGGNTGSTFQNDYVQLYNRGTTTVDLAGWTIQYASAAGTSWANKQPLGGLIAPGQYYLIALASGSVQGAAALPPANITGEINMSATSGKLALVDNGVTLAVDKCPTGIHVRDFVGYGTANCSEGTAAPGASNTTAIFRQGGGFIDTDENSADFTAGPPAPITTAPIMEIGPAVLSTDPIDGATTAPRDATIDVTFTEPVDVFGPWFDISCAVSGAHNDATTAVSNNGKDHYVTPNVNFQPGEQCTVTVSKNQISDSDTDDTAPNTNHLPADYVWSFSVATGATPPYTPDVHLTMGNPSGATTDVNQPNNYLMSKPEYALSYNRDLGRPNWVSWHLTAEWFGTLTRVDTFRPDPQVPPDWYRVQSFDFQFSGFDRGHMTPNADRDLETSIPVNQATYLMSNMVAQAPDNNQGPWANLENYLRTLTGTRTTPTNELYIVSGPAGAGGTGSDGSFTTIAGGHVTVPAYTWKVAMVLPYGSGDVARVTCSTRTIAVIMPNVQGIRTNDSNDWMGYLTNVDAVESLTGLDFFSNVPQKIQNCIQAGVNGDNPDSQEITFASIAAQQYGNADFAVDATASSGLPVTLTVVSGPATIVNGQVHLTGAGSVTIRAAQDGNQAFAKAVPVEQSFTVAPGVQTIIFAALADRTFGDAALTMSATGGASGNPVTFAAAGTCASSGQDGATIALLGAGTCTVTASQAGNANYDAADAIDRTFTIAAAPAVFSSLSAPTIEAGTASVTIAGAIAANGLVPPGSVTIGVGATSVSAGIDGTGHFSAAVPTAALTTSGSPYAIGFGYAGGSNFTPASGSSTLTVVDRTAPVISGLTVTPNTLFFPTNTLWPVLVAYAASDASGTPVCSLSVTSNDDDLIDHGRKKGQKDPDIDFVVVGAHLVLLRAEKEPKRSPALVYTITVTCTDRSGNVASANTGVAVRKR